MLSVIKTAIITIVISFISGVLLDKYKNVAPRILCSTSCPIPMKRHNSRIKVYVLSIKNTSKKTIHSLSVNIQGIYDDLKVNNAKTRGLKYDISKEHDFYNINIPFMIKNDEFYAELIVEEDKYVDNEPIVTLRSPDNFKEVRSKIKGKSLYSVKEKESSNFFITKKALIGVVALFLAVYIGVTAFDNFKKISADVINISNEENKDDNKLQTSNNSEDKKGNIINKVAVNKETAESKSTNSVNKTEEPEVNSPESMQEDNVDTGSSHQSGDDKSNGDSQDKNVEINTESHADKSPVQTAENNSDVQSQTEADSQPSNEDQSKDKAGAEQ